MSIAQVGNTAAIAAVGSKGLRYYWQTIGTRSWHSESVADPIPPISGASLTQIGNTAAIASVRQDGSVWYHWQTIGDSGPWNEEQVAVPPNSASVAVVAAVGNTAAIAAAGAGGLRYYWQTIGAGPWHGEQLAKLNVPIVGTALAQVGNEAVVMDIRPDGGLWVHLQVIGNVPWFPHLVPGPGGTFSPVTATAVASVGSIGIAAVRGDGLKYFWAGNGPGPWHEETLSHPTEPVIGVSLAHIGNTAAIAAVRQDGSLWHYFQTINTVPWYAQLVASPNSTSLPITAASVTQVGNSTAIAAVRQDGSLWFFWQPVGSAVPWKQELVAAPGSVLV
jgi:hypothetical protein